MRLDIPGLSTTLKTTVFSALALGAAVMFAPSATAVTTTITVTGTSITVDCTDGSDPVCQGFTAGGANNFPSSAGTLSPTSADLYTLPDNNPETEAQALDILIDGLDDDDFVGTDADKDESGSTSFITDAAYLVFKIGSGQLAGSHFFLALAGSGLVEILFEKNGQTGGGGLSHVSAFGGSITRIPLPASLPLFLVALGGLALVGRRRLATEA